MTKSAADSPQSRWSIWPLAIVLLVLAIGFLLVFTWHWRKGAVVIGGAVFLGALLRLVLPPQLAGLLVVRSKFIDVAIMGFLGLAIMLLGVVVPGIV